ncbi:MAG: hypothetical protein V3V00_04470 [Saprospiraceae bacterium]
MRQKRHFKLSGYQFSLLQKREKVGLGLTTISNDENTHYSWLPIIVSSLLAAAVGIAAAIGVIIFSNIC